MEDKIKEIVSVFIKVPADQIGAATPVDRTAVNSSILLHRMYARLAAEGMPVEDYSRVKVFGDLLPRTANPAPGATDVVASSAPPAWSGNGAAGPGVGIDIEEVAALPQADDLRTEPFYTQNFAADEIAYCILQPDPYASLAGLFAVKEAIVKADGQYRHRPFHTIAIGHSPEGRPQHPGFGLSISHAGGLAVAVAVREGGSQAAAGPAAIAVGSGAPVAAKPGTAAWIGWIALLLAAAALMLALKH